MQESKIQIAACLIEGRGIGSRFQERKINSMAEAIFSLSAKPVGFLCISGIWGYSISYLSYFALVLSCVPFIHNVSLHNKDRTVPSLMLALKTV